MDYDRHESREAVLCHSYDSFWQNRDCGHLVGYVEDQRDPTSTGYCPVGKLARHSRQLMERYHHPLKDIGPRDVNPGTTVFGATSINPISLEPLQSNQCCSIPLCKRREIRH